MSEVTAAEKQAVANIGTRPLNLALHSLRGNRGPVNAREILSACRAQVFTEHNGWNEHAFSRRIEYVIDMLASRINLSRAIGQAPQPGCDQAWVSFGDAEVLVEYSVPTDDDTTPWPLCIYINGSWVDVCSGIFTESALEGWSDQITEQRETARIYA
jgi:hypothetical protein